MLIDKFLLFRSYYVLFIIGHFKKVHKIKNQPTGRTRNISYVKMNIDKKDNQFFLIYKQIQSGAVAKSYMRKGFLIYEEMRKYFPIYED